MKSGKNPGLDRVISTCYQKLTDIVDIISRKKAQKIAVNAADEKSIQTILNDAGQYVFRQVLGIIREEVINSALPMEMLETAVYYGGVVLCKDFSVFLNDAKILHTVVSKLTPDEKKGLEKTKNVFVAINKKNCNNMLKLAKDNLNITRSERNALNDFIIELGWMDETKIVSITTAVKSTGNDSEEKKRNVAS